MLLFGEAVNTVNLYDIKKDGVTQEIPCSVPSYKQLIGLCFEPQSTATFLQIYISSMIYHLANPMDQPIDTGSIPKLLDQLSANPNHPSSAIKLAQIPESKEFKSLKRRHQYE